MITKSPRKGLQWSSFLFRFFIGTKKAGAESPTPIFHRGNAQIKPFLAKLLFHHEILRLA